MWPSKHFTTEVARRPTGTSLEIVLSPVRPFGWSPHSQAGRGPARPVFWPAMMSFTQFLEILCFPMCCCFSREHVSMLPVRFGGLILTCRSQLGCHFLPEAFPDAPPKSVRGPSSVPTGPELTPRSPHHTLCSNGPWTHLPPSSVSDTLPCPSASPTPSHIERASSANL